jgi:L-lactate dehydrogenase complex protein LldG
MTPREEMIGRIKEALRLAAHVPGQDHVPTEHPPQTSHIHSSARDWLPLVPTDAAGRIASFARCSVDLKTHFFQVNDFAEAAAKVEEIAHSEGWKLVASHRMPIVENVLSKLELPIIYTDDRVLTSELEKADAGITGCDALIAQTGSILLTTRTGGGRALSVLPPHHLVVATVAQVIADLPSAFQLLQDRYGNDFPSFMTLITGPSRTGDIERTLVLGAHGPKTVTVILVGNEQS